MAKTPPTHDTHARLTIVGLAPGRGDLWIADAF
jgi:uracil-DNA glycosylase